MRISEIAFIGLYLLTFAASVAFVKGVHDGKSARATSPCQTTASPIYWHGFKGGLP
jgi:hypothetical protein